MNIAILSGRLTADPVIRGSSVKVAHYDLAVSVRDTTSFIPITAFDKRAEFAEKYLKKGRRIVVEGRIETGSYTDKDGRKVKTFSVVASNQEFADDKPKDTDDEDGFMEIPDSLDELFR